jgi:digeranylgeranylglycerophospholipid reductase
VNDKKDSICLRNERNIRLNCDAIVIGAGPSGLIAASEIAKADHNVIVFEEHESIGEPTHCAGLLSTTGLETLSLKPPQSVIQNQVDGARIHSPNGEFIEIKRGRREAFVVNRILFDKWLADRAIEYGIQIETQSKVYDLIQKKDIVRGVIVGDDKKSVSAEVVINAEGVRGVISRLANLQTVPKKYKLPAYQYEIENVDIDEKMVEMYYGRDVAPGFFAWIIPLGENRARVGIASKSNPRKRLQRFIKTNANASNKFHGFKIVNSFGGIVLVGLPIAKTWKEGMFVVGDAAGHVKATTGGGVIMGGTAARIAGDVANAILAKTRDKQDYSTYETLWRSQILNELRTMYITQRGLTSLSNEGLDTLIHGINELGLVDVIHSKGDMDRQKDVILSLMKNPRIIPLGLNVIRFLNPFIK